MIYHSAHYDDYFAWKTRKKLKKHPNTKFLHIFQMAGTTRLAANCANSTNVETIALKKKRKTNFKLASLFFCAVR